MNQWQIVLGQARSFFESVMLKGEKIEGRRSKDSSNVMSIWWGYFPVSMVALLGLLITFYSFREITDWEKQRVYTAFREASQDRVLVVQREFKHTLATIKDIASYFEASSVVGRREFRKFVEPAIKRHDGIRALMWIPRVLASEREEFVRGARESFPPFMIKQMDPAGEVMESEDREEFFPVLYVQPYRQNRELLGIDMALDPVIFRLLIRSGETGQLQVSSRVPVMEEQIEQSGFVVSVPVYARRRAAGETDAADTDDFPPPPIRGFAVGLFSIGDIVELALESLSVGGIDMQIYEEHPNSEEIPLYRHASRMTRINQLSDSQSQSEPRLHYRQSLSLGGRYWGVVCTPIAGRFQADSWSGWIVLTGGISFTVLLTVYVSTLVGRTKKVNRLVGQRTSELSGAVAALNKEIMERKSAELELKTLNDDLEYWIAIRSSEAERRAQDLEQFAYVTSHDLKAPLRAIGNLAEWIGEDLAGKLNDESREQLKLLQDRVKRMNALIEGLLEYSSVGRSEGSYTLVDTHELLEELVDSLSPAEGFTIKIKKGMPVFRTDRLLLGQVFSNLIGNSLKHHGGDHGKVVIAAEEREHFFEFSVSDDGIGIASSTMIKSL